MVPVAELWEAVLEMFKEAFRQRDHSSHQGHAEHPSSAGQGGGAGLQ